MFTVLTPEVSGDDIANMICHTLYYFIQQQHDQNCHIYVNTSWSLRPLINICRWNKKGQRSMIANPGNSKILIDNYKWEILMSFKLSFYLFVTSSLNLVYVEVLSNIQC